VASTWPSVATLIGGGLNQAKCLGALPAAFARPGARKTMGIRVCAPVFKPALCIFIDLFGRLTNQNKAEERRGERDPVYGPDCINGGAFLAKTVPVPLVHWAFGSW